MAVEIITPGILPAEGQVYRLNCTHCGCRFKFRRSDTLFAGDERSRHWMLVACPTCERPVFVDHVSPPSEK